jgi:hypothetical protein
MNKIGSYKNALTDIFSRLLTYFNEIKSFQTATKLIGGNASKGIFAIV